MKVAIRCDASGAIGTGHVMRCLTLAEQLRHAGADVNFISREHVGNINDHIERCGYQLHRLPLDPTCDDVYTNEYDRWLAVPIEREIQDTIAWMREQESSFDWLAVDHYGLDERWERAMRPLVEHIAVIDDLANRKHDCDLLIDQSYCIGHENRYDGLLPNHCRTLLGPEYALLRREFFEVRENLRTRGGHVKNILVFLGGVDPSNETSKTVTALASLQCSDVQVDVVIGSRNPHEDEIRTICSQHPGFVVHKNVNNMALLMAQADLAIGAGGTTTWERCFLGLPTITLVIANNQRKMVEALADLNVTINAGWGADISTDDLANQLRRVINDKQLLCAMERKSLELMGSRDCGQAHAVIGLMLKDCYALS